MGLCSGVTYNYGLSFRRWFGEDNFAFQLNLFPLIYKYHDEYDDESYTRGIIKGGLTFLKGVKSYKYARLLYYANGTATYDIDLNTPGQMIRIMESINKQKSSLRVLQQGLVLNSMYGV